MVAPSSPVDSAGCDREPIHLPGSIQPHGFLVGVKADSREIAYVSESVESFLGRSPSLLLGAKVEEGLGAAGLEAFQSALQDRASSSLPRHFRRIALGGPAQAPRWCDLIVHLRAGLVIIEGEWAVDLQGSSLPNFSHEVSVLLLRMEKAKTIADLLGVMVQEIRRVSGFDRVLIYGFDSLWNGTVLAESRNEVLPTFVNLRFPATDIPRQARDLYLLNPLRLIPDSNYGPAKIVAAPGAEWAGPIDLSLAVLRSVSPVHREYMRNMGTRASMSASIIRGDQLWGLVSCHCKEPRYVPFETRNLCATLTQVFSLQLAARENARTFEQKAEGRASVSQLLREIAHAPDYVDGLAATGDGLLDLTAAEGAAIVSGSRTVKLGFCPSDEAIRGLVEWLAIHATDPVATFDHLAALYPPASAWSDRGAGILVAWISLATKSCLIWFRPEEVRMIDWGGDPWKPEPLPGVAPSPRVSFELWREMVRGHSLPWDQRHVEAAGELRSAIVEVVLGHTDQLENIFAELARLHRELETFAYSVAHDVHGPLLRVIAFAKMLEEASPERLSGEERQWVERLHRNAQHSSALMGHLLGFTEIGRVALHYQAVDVEEMFDFAYEELLPRFAPVRFVWVREALPRVEADPALLRIALEQLVGNAMKFSASRPEPTVEIAATENDFEHVLSIKDNGRGFAPAEAERIFSVFERMNRTSDEDGMGVGLAIARRAIARHGGRVWADGRPGEGATFFVALPRVRRGELDVVRQQVAFHLESRPAS